MPPLVLTGVPPVVVRVGAAWLIAAVVLGVLTVVTWAMPASANHASSGSGGCGEHTAACYPDCRYEWTGVRGSTIDLPVDGGPCEFPQVVTGTVAVANPTTHVTIDNPTTAVTGVGRCGRPSGRR